MTRSLLGGLLLGIVGVAGRLIPHPPNFTPVDAIALYGGAWMPSLWMGLALPVLIMAISDLLIGWHSLWPYTWGSMMIGAVLGRYLLKTHQFLSVVGLPVLQSTIFFAVTNFGVWLSGYYGYTMAGLWSCYVAAIPFYHYQVLGAISYSLLLWAVERFVIRRLALSVR
ncbi:MAG: DUF6580 family putative transport protein [Bacteroidia bacterium]